MVIRVVSSILRSLTWCFLVSVGIASMEGIGYFLTLDPNNSLSITEFILYFSNTCGIFLVTTTFVWFFIWFFLVWLGGVRSGIALFFMLFFFMVFGYLVIVLDVLFTHTDKYTAYWAVLLRYFVFFALFLATLSSMIVGKIFRRFRPVNLSLGAFTIFVLLLMGLAYAVWARNTEFSQAPSLVFWGIFTAASAVIVFLWLFGRTPRRLGISLAVLFIMVFAPLPVAYLSRPSSKIPLETVIATTHPVKHVIMVTVDTLRQDALAPYNSDPSSSPYIDQFAKDGVVFTNAYSTSPWTYPSVTSILTGLTPRVHHLVDGKSALSKKVPTMAEAMKSAGYHTAAFGCNSMLLPRSGLNRGFKEYHWFPDQVLQIANYGVGLAHNLLSLYGSRKTDAVQLTDQTIQWLKENAKQDFFLWVHYFDPHMPYMPPEKYQPTDAVQRELGDSFSETRAARGGTVARTAKERTWIRALYDGEVRYMDAQIGRLFDSLKKMGIYDDALIVFTSDHGEEFWDHDRFEHGHTLYNELVRVPFIIKVPGKQVGVKINACVTNQAVMPTIIDLCKGATYGEGVLLPSLSTLFKGQPEGYIAPPVFIGASLFHDHMEGVIFDQMKYIRATLSGHEQLFNLKEDPEERNSIAAQDPINIEKGRQLIKDAQSVDSRLSEQLGICQDEKNQLNQEDVRSLQALGYL